MDGCRFQNKSFTVYLNTQKFSANYENIVFKGGGNKMNRKLKKIKRILQDIEWNEVIRKGIGIIFVLGAYIILCLIKLR